MFFAQVCGKEAVQCVEVRCSISDLAVGDNLAIMVEGYLDEYFYIVSLQSITEMHWCV